MSLEKRLEFQRLCNEIESVVGNQDISHPYTGIEKNVRITIHGGKFADAEKEFFAALGAFSKSWDKDALTSAVDEYLKRITERF